MFTSLFVFDDRPFLLPQRVHQLWSYMQVVLYQLPRSQRHPLVQRHVGKAVTFEHLQKPQALITCVLDVVPHGERYVPYITGPVIESSGRAIRREHRHARRAREVILPLVVIRVPMHFPHSARLDFYQRRRDCSRNGEVGGIDDAHGSARGYDRLL